jgi:hypothetical protein
MNHSRITVVLKGGLGNQMFQYAAALGLAHYVPGAQVECDTVYLDDRFPRLNFAHRELALDVFAVDLRLTKLSTVAKRAPLPGVWLGLDALGRTLRHRAGLSSEVSDDAYAAYLSRLADVTAQAGRGPRELYLSGYYQTHQTFKHAAASVRAAFSFARPAEPTVAELLRQVECVSSVSIHVRRGDYLNAKNARVYELQDANYYRRAVEAICESMPDPFFYVFSDDESWCRNNLAFLRPRVAFVPSDAHIAGYKASGHLRLMAACKGHVISNSTYSWWGAWLDNDPVITVAPKHWFRKQERNACSPIPPDWVVV